MSTKEPHGILDSISHILHEESAMVGVTNEAFARMSSTILWVFFLTAHIRVTQKGGELEASWIAFGGRKHNSWISPGHRVAKNSSP